MKNFWSTLAEANEGLHADKLKALAGNISRLSSHLEFSAVVEDFGSRTLGKVKDAWFANPHLTIQNGPATQKPCKSYREARIPMVVRAYLRASTEDQNAERARADLAEPLEVGLARAARVDAARVGAPCASRWTAVPSEASARFI